MVLGIKMAYPGLTLAIMMGVAIGTAIYYYFNNENGQQQRQQAYQYDRDTEPESEYDPWSSRASTSGLQRRRRRNNDDDKCSICLDDIMRGNTIAIAECGHEFHKHCITMWFRQNKNCPNCRRPVESLPA